MAPCQVQSLITLGENSAEGSCGSGTAEPESGPEPCLLKRVCKLAVMPLSLSAAAAVNEGLSPGGNYLC